MAKNSTHIGRTTVISHLVGLQTYVNFRTSERRQYGKDNLGECKPPDRPINFGDAKTPDDPFVAADAGALDLARISVGLVGAAARSRQNLKRRLAGRRPERLGLVVVDEDDVLSPVVGLPGVSSEPMSALLADLSDSLLAVGDIGDINGVVVVASGVELRFGLLTTVTVTLPPPTNRQGYDQNYQRYRWWFWYKL